MGENPASETSFSNEARRNRWVVLLITAMLLAGSYLTLKNLRDTLEAQVTDRLTQAISHINNENLEIRLGGIYALGHIAAVSERDYWPIMEILITYVRERASVGKNQTLKKPPQRLAPDIQAALDVIGRRQHSYNDGESQRLDLRGRDLRRANLAGAKLAGAILSEVHLEEANLTGISLEEAILREAHLEQSTLAEAKMEGAFLLNASLKGARLQATNLQRAFLVGTSFDGANLLGADFTEAFGLTWEQMQTAKRDSGTRLPDYLKAHSPADGVP